MYNHYLKILSLNYNIKHVKETIEDMYSPKHDPKVQSNATHNGLEWEITGISNRKRMDEFILIPDLYTDHENTQKIHKI